MSKDLQKPSMHLAYAMRKKARKMAKGGKVKRDENVKGVHQTSYEDPGQSMAGMYARAAKEGAPGKEKLIAHAKKEHETILKELREMKKPMLYAKGGAACADCANGVCMAHGGKVEIKEHPAEVIDVEPSVIEGMKKRLKAGKEYKGKREPVKDIMDDSVHYKPKKKMAYGGDVVDRAMQKYSQGGKVANKTTMAADMKPNQFDDLVLDDDLDFEYTGENSGDHLGNAREDHDRKDIVARIMKSRAKKDRMPRPA